MGSNVQGDRLLVVYYLGVNLDVVLIYFSAVSQVREREKVVQHQKSVGQ